MEKERVIVNTSSYNAEPQHVTVGKQQEVKKEENTKIDKKQSEQKKTETKKNTEKKEED